MGVLSDYRVLDLTDEKGMFCTQILSDMGAEVIRIVKTGVGIPETDHDLCYLNPAKQNISLSLENKVGQELFSCMIKKTDVLVETEASGYLESLGLGYSILNRQNPELVMVSITHFGQNGPYRDYKSCDLVAEAMGGWLSVTGESRAPLKLFGNQAYCIASLFATNSILLALQQRQITERGQYIDISIIECVAAARDHALIRFFYEDTLSTRQGGRHWNNSYQLLPCNDGYILLSLSPRWETLVTWLESEGLAADLTDERWRHKEARIKGLEHIIDVLKRWTLTHSVAELVEKGQLMHFPWAKVSPLPEVYNTP
jgi:crotonobetainyl-CoA:carnitine CoA-transferase CaiB-like acyl-CoA transferase